MEVITIGGIKYNVIEFDKDIDRNLMGKEQYDVGKIFIRSDLPVDKKLETLLHEVIHVIYQNAYLAPGDEEERIVGALSCGLYNFLKDNKDVFRVS
jgi:hypothetical protein